jgi:methylmalonyl-CoA mutase
MNSINDKRVYMRSMATRENNVSVSPYIHSALNVLKLAHPDIIILETSGIGQSGSEITEIADVSMYVMTPEYGASTQLEKIDMLDYADLIAFNKSDKRGALDALQAVRKQYQRNHTLFEQPLEEMPVFSTKASQFNDWGTTEVYNQLIKKLNSKFSELNLNEYSEQNVSEDSTIIPPKRVRYLSEIVDNNKNYDKEVEEQALIAKKMYLIDGAKALIDDDEHTKDKLEKVFLKAKKELSEENRLFLQGWKNFKEEMKQDTFTYLVRGKEIKVETKYESLSHLKIPKIALPKFQDWGDLVRWKGQENVPGAFPYTSGIYPFKRTVKILPECLQEKAVQNVPTEDSTMFLRKCLRKDFLQRLILLHFTDKILLYHQIFTEKLEMREFLLRL